MQSEDKPESNAPGKWLWAPIVVGGVALVFVVLELVVLHPYWEFRPFRIAGDSLCPALCKGERVFIHMGPKATEHIRRDEVVAMKLRDAASLYVKRVIGLPGDVVSPGPNNEILVNGKKWSIPAPCGTPPGQPEPASAGTIVFEEQKVPEGDYYVVGDNLDHSLDSRSPQFGFVPKEDIVGEAGMIYWSSGRGRFGCVVR